MHVLSNQTILNPCQTPVAEKKNVYGAIIFFFFVKI